jgi:hypothetical protein
MRDIVWINGIPVLLPFGASVTEDEVNTALSKLGRGPLGDHDVINGVERILMRGAVTGSLEMKYREKRP